MREGASESPLFYILLELVLQKKRKSCKMFVFSKILLRFAMYQPFFLERSRFSIKKNIFLHGKRLIIIIHEYRNE